MPVQTQNSSFASRLGGRVAAANAEHRDKPVDTGNRRLPGGIRNGVAKISAMYTKEQTEDNSKTPKGETFFRASAIVMSPEHHNGEKVAGAVTQVVIPLCDVPAKGQRKAVTFSENWFDFQNLFKLLGIAPPTGQQYDTTGKSDAEATRIGQLIEAYYFSAMKALTDPQRPVYVEFSTRGWTPPATPQQPHPEEMVFETWHGKAEYNGKADPAAQVIDRGSVPPPASTSPPPVPPPATEVPTVDPADEVAALVEAATNDPEGATEEGRMATSRLEQLAWAAGWPKEQTANAPDWAVVGDMALNPPQATNTPPPPIITPQNSVGTVVVGGRWMFAKRTKDGAKLKNNKGEEFPSNEVEVVTISEADKTCTVKTVKDGKDVVDIRTKKPVIVKWEWLELVPAY